MAGPSETALFSLVQRGRAAIHRINCMVRMKKVASAPLRIDTFRAMLVARRAELQHEVDARIKMQRAGGRDAEGGDMLDATSADVQGDIPLTDSDACGNHCPREPGPRPARRGSIRPLHGMWRRNLRATTQRAAVCRAMPVV